MLTPVNLWLPEIAVRDAVYPAPFAAGLEFNAPARGTWNIVHTGMLIPESHQIFACARGCLRGVVLTAAEMCAMDRMSYITVEEGDLISGELEKRIIEGSAHILRKLPRKPRCVLLFLSCVQLFAGMDFPLVLRELAQRFPDVDFVDAYMHPTMRKSGLTPDQMMRRQLYASLHPRPVRERQAAILGNDFMTDPDSELRQMFAQNDWHLADITTCRSYAEFQSMAESAFFLATLPAAKAGAEHLAERLQRPLLYLPQSFSFAEIRQNLNRLAETLRVPCPALNEDAAHAALEKVRQEIGTIPVTLDYTATPRPLGLARLLLEHGFNVQKVFLDAISAEEEADFQWLQAHHGALHLAPTVHAAMRFAAKSEPVLAIGQKAAYFSGTRHFVNIVAGGGLYGFTGIIRLAGMIREAFLTEKDTEKVIRLKGFGCRSCLS